MSAFCPNLHITDDLNVGTRHNHTIPHSFPMHRSGILSDLPEHSGLSARTRSVSVRNPHRPNMSVIFFYFLPVFLRTQFLSGHHPVKFFF